MLIRDLSGLSLSSLQLLEPLQEWKLDALHHAAWLLLRDQEQKKGLRKQRNKSSSMSASNGLLILMLCPECSLPEI